ncbi:transcription factor BIM3 isoform X1 [Ziziphus jujuba]|uniref:Transcription factor BIM3 isoform X1 n=1 Tax=Ziziphus jujuba TaxID=326968 RepID=A0A6P3ZJU7_ZIZJJ|nr:transcription factor BIM3 isoform X1 [Ziziphus jujuba]
MVKPSKGHHEELEDDDEVPHRVKVDGKNREKNRSKHSETEQRRRSKINERFQILRDLIPQDDQKKDKASFLLEVIEYIRFLQEKLNMYEGSYPGWSSEPTKLTPWRNQHGPTPTESFVDHPQVIKSDSGLQNNVSVSPSMLCNAPNLVETELGSTVVYKSLDHLPGSAGQVAPLNVQQPIFDSIGRGGVPTQPLQESVSDAVNIDLQPQQPELWSGRHTTDCSVLNNTPNFQEKSRSVSISSAYSKGILDTLTQALRSSGMDLSQASISVQIDVGNGADNGVTSMASSSKDHVNQTMNSQVMAHTQVTSSSDQFEQAHKRLRTEEN